MDTKSSGRRGRKKHICISEEFRVFDVHRRRGDISLWLENNPELIYLEKENVSEPEDVSDSDAIEQGKIVELIWNELSERQRQVWSLRAEYKTFKEITLILGCSERTVYGDWKKIREVARKYYSAD